MPKNISRAVPAETRKLTAIMFTAIVGFSRQMGVDEARMLQLLDTHNQLIQQAGAEHLEPHRLGLYLALPTAV